MQVWGRRGGSVGRRLALASAALLGLMVGPQAVRANPLGLGPGPAQRSVAWVCGHTSGGCGSLIVPASHRLTVNEVSDDMVVRKAHIGTPIAYWHPVVGLSPRTLQDTPPATPVPEPASGLLLMSGILGLAGMALLRRRGVHAA